MTNHLSPSDQIRVLAKALTAYGTAPWPQKTTAPFTRAHSLGTSHDGEGHQYLAAVGPCAGIHIAALAELYDLGWEAGDPDDLHHPSSGADLTLIRYDKTEDPPVITAEILEVLAETGVPVTARYLAPEDSWRDPVQVPTFDVRLQVKEWDGSEVELLQRLSALVHLPLPVRIRRFTSAV